MRHRRAGRRTVPARRMGADDWKLKVAFAPNGNQPWKPRPPDGTLIEFPEPSETVVWEPPK